MSTASPVSPTRRADRARGAIPIARLTRLLVGLRFRLLRNLLRRRRRSGGAPGLAPLLGLVTSVAYVGLFSQSFAAIVAATDGQGQAAALSLIVGVIVLGTLAAKAAAGDTVLAGSPENEFWLSRPTSLPSLVLARSLAGAVTDPFGALFLFPVLVAAAITWDLGPGSWLVAAASSMIVQIGVSAGAQAVQIAVVRYAPPTRRRAVWMALRLLASLTLAALWMTGTWVLRAPRAMAAAVSSWQGLIGHTPGAWVVHPLLAARRDQPWGVAAALAVLLAVTGAVLALAFGIARRAGMRGWEEAGAPWAEANPRVAPSARMRPLTAATKDLRLILRDRSQLLALIAAPIIFVGIQIFGAAGWDWSTANLRRVAVLSFSLCLYMATIGPLAHMQAERRAFWILRTVPVSIGRLMLAKARAWALLLGALAGGSFLILSAGVAGAGGVASPSDRLALALWVAVGAGGMAFIAVGLACQAADLSDEQRPAIGPATIYLFMLVGGLYNCVLRADGADRWRGLILYLFVAVALWTSGMKQAEDCLDPEAHRWRPVRIGDAAVLVLVGALGSRAVLDGARLVGEQGPAVVGLIRAALTVLLGSVAAIYLGRRPPQALPPAGVPRLALGSSLGLAVVLGAGLALLLRRTAAAPLPTLPASTLAGWMPGALLVAVPLLLAEELVWRGLLQRALEEQAAQRRWAVPAAAVVTLVIGWVAAGGQPMTFLVVAHAVPSLLRALTGRTSASFLGRLALVTALALPPLG